MNLTLTPVQPLTLTQTNLSPMANNPAVQPWGWHLVLNLYNCDPSAIRSATTIEHFVIDLCDLIKMRRFGDPVIVKFGDDPAVTGYSMFQLIETSNICAHFAEQTNAAYLDIFSCQYFDPQVAAEFCMNTFNPQTAIGTFINRE